MDSSEDSIGARQTMHERRIAIWAVALCGSISLGCSTVAPMLDSGALEVNGYSYTGGKATQFFNFPKASVEKAVREAMDDLHMRVERETHDGVVAFVEGRTADDRRMQISLRPQQETTRVTVKIFWFGDEPLSRAFTDRVGIRLGALPPQAIPETPPSSPEPNPLIPARSKVMDSEVLNKQAEMLFHDDQSIQ